MSQKARTEYIKAKVEKISSDQDILNIEGDFQYTQDRFALRGLGSGKFYAWHEIAEIKAYKVDLMTTDDVRLDISFSDVVLTISEEIPGWPLFIDKLMRALPNILIDWEDKIIQTPFAANTTIIYKR